MWLSAACDPVLLLYRGGQSLVQLAPGNTLGLLEGGCHTHMELLMSSDIRVWAVRDMGISHVINGSRVRGKVGVAACVPS